MFKIGKNGNSKFFGGIGKAQMPTSAVFAASDFGYYASDFGSDDTTDYGTEDTGYGTEDTDFGSDDTDFGSDVTMAADSPYNQDMPQTIKDEYLK